MLNHILNLIKHLLAPAFIVGEYISTYFSLAGIMSRDTLPLVAKNMGRIDTPFGTLSNHLSNQLCCINVSPIPLNNLMYAKEISQPIQTVRSIRTNHYDSNSLANLNLRHCSQ